MRGERLVFELTDDSLIQEFLQIIWLKNNLEYMPVPEIIQAKLREHLDNMRIAFMKKFEVVVEESRRRNEEKNEND